MKPSGFALASVLNTPKPLDTKGAAGSRVVKSGLDALYEKPLSKKLNKAPKRERMELFDSD